MADSGTYFQELFAIADIADLEGQRPTNKTHERFRREMSKQLW